jgi:Ca2+-binding EF-hand superfamily protein
LRVKLNLEDIKKVFDFMDKDNDANLNYNEFCAFTEEKRRNIDPFDQINLDSQNKSSQ